jgi:hypothetical protein
MRRLLAALLAGLLALAAPPAGVGAPSSLPRPILDFDFVSHTCAYYGFTDARTGVYYKIGADGNYTAVAANTCADQSFGVGGTPARGLGIWSGWTEVIRNNSMQGAAVGTPGTLPTNWVKAGGTNAVTVNVAGLNTVNGIDTIDLQFTGTPAGAGNTPVCFESTTQIVASSGQVRQMQAFLETVAGDRTNVSSITLALRENTSAGVLVQNDQSADMTIATSGNYAGMRQTASYTLSGGGTVARVQPCIQVNYTAASPINITLRLGWPMTALNSFPQPRAPVRTTAGSQAIQADKIVATAASLGLPANISSMVIQVAYSQDAATTFQGSVSVIFDDGTDSNRYQTSTSSTGGPLGTIGADVVQAGTVKAGLEQTIAPVGTQHCMAHRLGVDGIASAVDGSTVVNNAGASTPIAFTEMTLGRITTVGTDPFDGYIQRVRVYIADPPDAALSSYSQRCWP